MKRYLPDRRCPACGVIFRPYRATQVYHARSCWEQDHGALSCWGKKGGAAFGENYRLSLYRRFPTFEERKAFAFGHVRGYRLCDARWRKWLEKQRGKVA